MSLNRSNEGEQSKELSKTRIVNLDFLRGFFVYLALAQHFTYYINMWYVEYFRDAIALTTTYKIHFPMIGRPLVTDYINYVLGVTFIPWVSQVYLTLASFNLGKRPQNEFREQLSSKLKLFGMIFLFFVMENFIVAPNTGQAISFYPIMLWMVVLSIVSIVYSVIGISGVVVLTILSFVRFIFPIEILSNLFQGLMVYNVHPGFEYDARVEYFFSSGCLGFLMGYVHYNRPDLKKIKDLIFILMGVVFVAVWFLFGDPIVLNRANAFYNEHALAQTFTGTLYVLGIQSIVISAFLWMEQKGIKVNAPVFNWIGTHSIFVFAFHRIFFVRIFMPVVVLIGSMTGRTLGASSLEIYSYALLTVGVCYLIKRSRMGELVLQVKG